MHQKHHVHSDARLLHRMKADDHICLRVCCIDRRVPNRPETCIQMPVCAVCLSPWTDLTGSGESLVTCADKDIFINPSAIKPAAAVYLGGADPRSPLASPLFADLHGLPPVLIQVGSDEVLLSDSTSFAERAQAVGADVTLEVWKNMQHVWQFAFRYLPEARQALGGIGEFIAEKTNGYDNRE